MLRICYTTVSDLAVCQRCPALFGYKVHRHEKDAWLQGIKGRGDYYGSMFHKNIARVFFEAAADPFNPLHAALARAISGGRAELEEFVRENIFMPFVEKYSDRYTSGQIMAAAEGVRVWVKAMHEFFMEIPSLMRNPERTMSTIFLAPEQKLQSRYDFRSEGSLIVTGCYDALMFNPDKAEARLFEFKGYAKSDAAVPLSQSLMYAWLIEKYSGIVPSVEIIYLDEEDREPDIFSPASVRNMIVSGLPELFYTAFSTIMLRRLPEMVKNKDFCGECRFRNECLSDWACKFKRKGASLVNVMVFMMAAVMITAHVFFFSALSSENMTVQAESLHQRFKFDKALHDAVELIGSHNFEDNKGLNPVNISTYKAFRYTNNGLIILGALQDGPRLEYDNPVESVSVDIYDLDYGITSEFLSNKYWKAIEKVDGYNTAANADAIIPNRIFPPMNEQLSMATVLLKPGLSIYVPVTKRYFLVRVYSTAQTYGQRVKTGLKKELMHQVLVRRTSPVINAESLDVLHIVSEDIPISADIISFQEVWY